MSEQHETRRERQARQTHEDILRAARELFAHRGYTRTAVRDIAEAAGVSAQTVYDSVGSKQVIVSRLNDLIDDEAGVLAIAQQSRTSDDPRHVAGTSARVTRSILENCGDIARALVTGAAAEPELAVVLDEGHRRHMAGAKSVVSSLEELGALDPAIGRKAAADTIAALADLSFGVLLRDTYGWSLERIETWTADATCRLLLKR